MYKTHTNTLISCAYLTLAIVLLFAFVGAAHAQTEPKTPETPALVVPKEEASTAVAPGQEMPSLAIPSEEQSNGSLSGVFLSSYVAHSQGNLTQALKYLRDALAKDPTNTQIAGQVLILQITLGHMDEAQELATKLRKAEKHELIVDLISAVDSVKNNDASAAKAMLESSDSKSFDHIWMPLLLEWMKSGEKDLKAITVTDIINAEGVTIPSFVYYHVALLNDARGFHDEASKQYQQAVSNLTRAPFRALMAYVNAKARMNDHEAIQQLLLDLKQERPDMEKLLKKEVPYLGDLASFGTLPSEPFIANNKQGVAEVLLTMASMLYTLDISQDIPLYLQMAIHLKPDFPTAQLMLGNYFESLELWNEAMNEYKKIRVSSPLYLKSAIRRAYVLEVLGDLDGASVLMKQLTGQFPKSISIWMAAGDLERNRAKYEQAIRYYDNAIELLNGKYTKPNWVMFFARGASYERLDKLVEAEQNMRQARNLSSEQPEVLNYIGYMWLEQGKKVFDAVKLIEKAYALSPNEPHIVDSMGWAFFKIGKLDKAIALLEHAAELLPNDITINEHLGDAYWHANRILEARYQWQRAKDFAETDKQTSELERKIKNGLTTYSFHTAPISTAPKEAEKSTKPAEAKLSPAGSGAAE